jgi:hypothetical protein
LFIGFAINFRLLLYGVGFDSLGRIACLLRTCQSFKSHQKEAAFQLLRPTGHEEYLDSCSESR